MMLLSKNKNKKKNGAFWRERPRFLPLEVFAFTCTFRTGNLSQSYHSAPACFPFHLQIPVFLYLAAAFISLIIDSGDH